MSKKRNQVLFTRPDDPKFLKLIKQQAGYKDDGPTVDTKVSTSVIVGISEFHVPNSFSELTVRTGSN